MKKQTLMAQCQTDVEKIRLWRDLLKSEDMTIKSAVAMVKEDALGNWITGEDQAGSYFTIPSFQRDYTYSSKQKTSLIESILLNIPIGSILVYQATQKDDTRTLPIIDGQHRLKTIYDFLNNRFKLNGRHLSFLHSLDGKRFEDLDAEFKYTIYDYTLTVLKARNTGDDVEETIEEFSNQCFIRMNENPNTMSPYTLLKAKYSSPNFLEYDHMLNVFFRRDKELRDMFSVSTRGQKDRYKLDITATLLTLSQGLNAKTNDIKSMAEVLIKEIQTTNEEEGKEFVNYLENLLHSFGLFLKRFHRFGVEQPLTHQILGDQPSNNINFKKGIAVRMALIFRHLKNQPQETTASSKAIFHVIQSSFQLAYKDDATLKYNNLKHFETIFITLYEDEIGPFIVQELQLQS